MLLMLSVNLCLIHGTIIWMLYFAFCNMFAVHLVMEYFSYPTLPFTYADVDWAGCLDTRESTTSWCMFFGTSLISWKCKKQNKVSKYVIEAEYHAMSSARSEIIWLVRLLKEPRIRIPTPIPLNADNTSTF